MKKQELIKKEFNGASNEEIFEAAKELIENGNWVFEIYNGDELMLAWIHGKTLATVSFQLIQLTG